MVLNAETTSSSSDAAPAASEGLEDEPESDSSSERDILGDAPRRTSLRRRITTQRESTGPLLVMVQANNCSWIGMASDWVRPVALPLVLVVFGATRCYLGPEIQRGAKAPRTEMVTVNRLAQARAKPRWQHLEGAVSHI
ncbi:hypothetical protein N9L68_00785 [bacterium]|nr:hypothetical protein [bacterium]